MSIARFLLTALASAGFAGSLSAQSLTSYSGTKANLTLTLTATYSIGGFLVKDSDYDANAAKGIEYDYQADPVGYVPNAASPAHYYSQRYSRKTKTYNATDYSDTLPVEETREDSVRQFTQRMTNAEFIQALIDDELVPLTSGKGYKLVVIQPAMRAGSESNPPLLFFIEKGASIYYVGGDALQVQFSADGTEARSAKVQTKYAHKLVREVNDGQNVLVLQTDDEGTTTLAHSRTGKTRLSLSLLNRFYAEGVVSFASRYDAKADLNILTNASMSDGYGPFLTSDGGAERSGLLNAGFSLSGGKVISDIRQYLEQLPEDLRYDIYSTYYPDSESE